MVTRVNDRDSKNKNAIIVNYICFNWLQLIFILFRLLVSYLYFSHYYSFFSSSSFVSWIFFFPYLYNYLFFNTLLPAFVVKSNIMNTTLRILKINQTSDQLNIVTNPRFCKLLYEWNIVSWSAVIAKTVLWFRTNMNNMCIFQGIVAKRQRNYAAAMIIVSKHIRLRYARVCDGAGAGARACAGVCLLKHARIIYEEETTNNNFDSTLFQTIWWAKMSKKLLNTQRLCDENDFAMNAYWHLKNVRIYTNVACYNCRLVTIRWLLSIHSLYVFAIRRATSLYLHTLKRMSLINFESTANILIKSNTEHTQLIRNEIKQDEW